MERRFAVTYSSSETNHSLFQVSVFTSKGIKAAFVGGEQDDRAVKDAVFEGQYQLVFISPESLIRNLRWREMLRNDVYQHNLVGLAVDEAHCVTKWYVALLIVLLPV